jgi:hypothetical protein
VDARVNLLELDREGLTAFCEGLGEKRFRATQLYRWIHQRGASDFEAMTDRARSLRDKLTTRAEVRGLALLSEHRSADGTVKWLFDVGAGNAVETVYIPEVDRGTLCVSSQAGCAVGCRFCSTGHQGFSRNLTTGEIVAQLWFAEHRLRAAAAEPGRAAERRIDTVCVVLAAGGATMADVVDLTSFHVDLPRTLGLFMTAKDAALTAPYPAWTAIGCSALASPGARVEVKATAVPGRARMRCSMVITSARQSRKGASVARYHAAKFNTTTSKPAKNASKLAKPSCVSQRCARRSTTCPPRGRAYTVAPRSPGTTPARHASARPK